jgi:hypothetical protein
VLQDVWQTGASVGLFYTFASPSQFPSKAQAYLAQAYFCANSEAASTNYTKELFHLANLTTVSRPNLLAEST